MRFERVALVAWIVLGTGCGNSSDGGPPKQPVLGGGGAGGSGGGAGGAGGSGGAGASTNGGSGGAGGLDGGTGGATPGAACADGDAGVVWSKLGGTYTMRAEGLGGGTETHFTEGMLYQIDVDAPNCSLVFHGDSDDLSCVWDGGKWNYAFETVPGTTWTIHIQDVVDQTQSTKPDCEVDYRIDLGQMDLAAIALPGQDIGGGFHPP